MFGSFLYVVLGHLGLQIVRYAQNDVAHGVAWHYGDWLAQYSSDSGIRRNEGNGDGMGPCLRGGSGVGTGDSEWERGDKWRFWIPRLRSE